MHQCCVRRELRPGVPIPRRNPGIIFKKRKSVTIVVRRKKGKSASYFFAIR
nr:MAG TPA: hypothetical protein [Caudoviricetes sp.]